MDEPIRILIADDHPAARLGIRQALEGPDFVVCAEVESAPAAVEAALSERPDVALLDIHMPGNGISAAKEISSSLPETAVVMLTVSADEKDLFDSLRAGASGYLLKDTDPARLPQALKGLLAGEAAIPRTLAALLVEEFRGRAQRRRVISRKRGARLTDREWDVLELMREGLTTREIAERLVVSEVTVRTHVSSILRKLQVPDREMAVSLLDES